MLKAVYSYLLRRLTPISEIVEVADRGEYIYRDRIAPDPSPVMLTLLI